MYFLNSEVYKGRHCFVAIGDGDDDVTPSVTFLDMSEDAFDDMGQPMRITVTVEPGDLLND